MFSTHPLGPAAGNAIDPITARQYARLVSQWIGAIGLDPSIFGTHSRRRTKATLRYRRTGNLRAIQLLLRHKKIESTVRYLGIEVDEQNSSALPQHPSRVKGDTSCTRIAG